MLSENQKNLADRYRLIVQWSDEDRKFIGLCPELFFGGTDGDKAEEVFRDLREMVEEEVEDRLKRGESLPEPSKEIVFS
jgi:predicted RNase H-like HicB family nuclease